VLSFIKLVLGLPCRTNRGLPTRLTLLSLSRKRLHDGLKHEPVVVGESNVELLQLNFGRSRPLLFFFGKIDQTLARSLIAIADFKIYGDLVANVIKLFKAVIYDFM
jgi:hypothetical protein